MTIEEVRTLPVAEKIQIMEAIWQDMRERVEQADVPQQLKDLLDQRRARAGDGSARVLDWDGVKAGIGRA